MWIIPNGVELSLITYVGNSAGAGLVETAKNYSRVGHYVGLCIVITEWVTFGLTYRWVARVMMSEKAAQATTMSLLWFFQRFFMFFDDLSPQLKGTLEAMNRGDLVFKILAIAFDCIAIPMALFLCFGLDL